MRWVDVVAIRSKSHTTRAICPNYTFAKITDADHRALIFRVSKSLNALYISFHKSGAYCSHLREKWVKKQ